MISYHALRRESRRVEEIRVEMQPGGFSDRTETHVAWHNDVDEGRAAMRRANGLEAEEASHG